MARGTRPKESSASAALSALPLQMSGADGKGTAMLDEKSSFTQQDGVWLYRDSDKEFQKSEELIMQRRRARAAAKADQASDTVPR